MVRLKLVACHAPSLVHNYIPSAIPTNEMLSEDDDILSVTLSMNSVCPSNTRYPVLVTFGTQPVGSGDHVGQINATEMTLSPGDPPVTFSVDANNVTLEVYCYMASINDTIGKWQVM